MRTNADCTLYARSTVNRAEAWTRTPITGVAWNDRKAANVLKSGLLEADGVAVYIPMSGRASLAISVGDVLVHGIVNDAIGDGFTMSDLRGKYAHVVTVRSVDTMRQGSPALWHWQIGAA